MYRTIKRLQSTFLSLLLCFSLLLSMATPFAFADEDDEQAIEIDVSWYDADNIMGEYVLTTAEEMYGFASLVNGGVTFEGVTIKLGESIDLTRPSITDDAESVEGFLSHFALEDDDAVLEDDDVVLEDDDAVLEDDDAVLEDDDAVLEDDDVVLEDDDVVLEDDDVVLEDDDVVLEDDDVVLEDDAVVLEDDEVVLEDDDVVLEDDDVVLEDDDVVLEDDDMVLEDDDVVLEDDDKKEVQSMLFSISDLDADMEDEKNKEEEANRLLWTAIGTNAKPFKGVFDGDENELTLYINTNAANQGLFGYASGAEIKNVTVNGEIINNNSTNAYYGSIVGYAENTEIADCINKAIITSQLSYTGGIAGQISSGSSITGCYNHGTISSNKNNVGGIAGEILSECSIIDCYNDGTISSGSVMVGGIAGSVTSGYIKNCINAGAVLTSSSTAGGVVGGISVTGGYSSGITACLNTGAVSGKENTGGIGGSVTSTPITSCVNKGNITGSGAYTGGIAGMLTGTSTLPSPVIDCRNIGSISGVDSVGGIAGYSTYTTSGTVDFGIMGAVSSGSVTGQKYVGGIVGEALIYSYVRWSTASGDITGTEYVGGIVGGTSADLTTVLISDCYVTSNILGTGDFVGGIAGRFGAPPRSCFYYNTDEGVSGSDSATMLHSGLTEANNLFYLSNSASNSSAKSDEEFKNSYVLGLLVGGSTPYTIEDEMIYNWGQGNCYPEITNEVSEVVPLYKVSIENKKPGESKANTLNSVSIIDPKDGTYVAVRNAYSEHIIVPSGEILLEVELAEGYDVTFSPDVVSKTVISQEDDEDDDSASEDGKDDGDGKTSEPKYIYSIQVNDSSVAIEYLFVSAAASNTDWYIADQNEYFISNEAELRGLSDLVNKGNKFADKTITLEDDIELVGMFMPIGNSITNTFNGTFDGAGNTISGLLASYDINGGALDYTALFGCTGTTAVIENLTVDGTVKGYTYGAGIVAYNNGAITNVTNNASVSLTYITGKQYFIGGITAFNNTNAGAISDCVNNGSITARTTNTENTNAIFIGGIVGKNATAEMSNCVNNGKITAIWAKPYAGGIAGQGLGNITESSNTGAIYAYDDVSRVSGSATYIGGISGQTNKTFLRCTNSGSIYTYTNNGSGDNTGARAGGIVGALASGGSIIESYNTANVTAAGANFFRVGGLTGDTAGTAKIGNSYNLGSVLISSSGAANLRAGGLIGYSAGTTSVYNSYNAGRIESEISTNYIGGLVGDSVAAATYENLYYIDTQGLPAMYGHSATKTTPLSDIQMKESSFATELGVAFAAENGRYPVLRWEEATSESEYGYVILNYKQSSFSTLDVNGVVVPYPEADTAVKIAINEDGTVDEPNDPYKAYFTFLGWFKDLDDAEEERFDFSAPIESETTLYAKWALLECKITFDYGFEDSEGKTFETVVYGAGASLEAIEIEREGFELIGWFLIDEEGNTESTPFDFKTKPTGDLHLIARWQQITLDYDWYTDSPQSETFYISSAAELMAFAKLVNGTAPLNVAAEPVNFQDVTVQLDNSIDMSEYTWTNIIGASSGTSFKGTFDGDNKAITGLNATGLDYVGLFGYVDSAVIMNFDIGGTVIGSNYVGAVAAYAIDTKIENVKSNTAVSGISYIGGIAGYSKGDVEFISCVNMNEITATGSYVGGITGYSIGNVQFSNTYNTDSAVIFAKGSYVGGITGYAGYVSDADAFHSVINEGNVSGVNYVGGIAGYITRTSAINIDISITDCNNYGDIFASESYAGGIVGRAYEYRYLTVYVYTHLTITGSSNEGKIEAIVSYAGGIVGELGGTVTDDYYLTGSILNCTNSGSVTASDYAGGIAGRLGSKRIEGRPSVLTYCENTGVIQASNGYAGGIAGYCYIPNYPMVLSNNGDVLGGSYAGGIFGYGWSHTGDIPANLTNVGGVKGYDYVGGLAGYFLGSLSDSYNTGSVSLTEGATSKSSVGGLIGYSKSIDNLSTSYNTGSVTDAGSAGYLGGIIGYSNCTYTISNSYNTGNVKALSAEAYVGGIVGYDYNYYKSSVITCVHNTGSISGEAEDRLGGIVGFKRNNTETMTYIPTSEAYYLKDSVATSNIVSGTTEKSAEAFISGELAYLLDGGDGERSEIWAQGESYPIFADASSRLVYKARVTVAETGGAEGSVSYNPTTVDNEWFITAGETASITITAQAGSILKLLSVKDANGKILASTGESGFFEFAMPANNVFVSAEFVPVVTEDHTITFNVEGKETQQNVEKNKAASRPVDPEKASVGDDAYVFVGWYTESEFVNLYDFNTILTEDITVYAKFVVAGQIVVYFNLNYDYDGEPDSKVPDTQAVKMGQLISEPSPPPTRNEVKVGDAEVVVLIYEFSGWYTDPVNGDKWDFENDRVPADVGEEGFTLYAYWEEIDQLKVKDEFQISSVSVLETLAENVRNGEDYSGQTFVLTASIALPQDWVSIGTVDNPFNGTFLGGGETITLTYERDTFLPIWNSINVVADVQRSLFQTIGKNGKVENLNVDGFISQLAGAIAVNNYGTISNCTVDVKKYIVAPAHQYTWGRPTLGGIVLLNYGAIENCKAKIDFDIDTVGVGGIAAYNYSSGEIRNCTLLKDSYIKAWHYYGGICGENEGLIDNCATEEGTSLQGIERIGYGNSRCGGISGTLKAQGIISNCTNNATLYGYENNLGSNVSTDFGGIAGTVSDGGLIDSCSNYGDLLYPHNSSGGIAGSSLGEITNCTNYGEVRASTAGETVGGVVGQLSYGGVVTQCVNYGRVEAAQEVGGIAGVNEGTISSSYNTSQIIASDQKAGGIAGSGGGTISECWNSGNVSVLFLFAGGIIGEQRAGTISDCYSTGGVKGSSTLSGFTGGLVGTSVSGEIKNCFYYYISGNMPNAPIIGYSPAGNISSKCYYLTGTNNTSSSIGIAVSQEAFTNGALAWLLETYEEDGGEISPFALNETPSHNNIWTQGINEGYPILGEPSYYRVEMRVDVDGVTSTTGEYSTVKTSKTEDGIFGTENLYLPEANSIYYQVEVFENKTVTTGENDEEIKTWYELESISLEGTDTDLGTSLSSSFTMPENDVVLVVSVIKMTDEEKKEEEEEEEPVEEEDVNNGNGTGDGSGTGTGIGGTGNGSGEGTGSGDGNDSSQDGGGGTGGEATNETGTESTVTNESYSEQQPNQIIPIIQNQQEAEEPDKQPEDEQQPPESELPEEDSHLLDNQAEITQTMLKNILPIVLMIAGIVAAAIVVVFVAKRRKSEEERETVAHSGSINQQGKQ